MKSSIKIALGENNNPVIQMRIHSTDDVRDILFNQFQESFCQASTLCHAIIHSGYTGADMEGLRSIITISPLSPNSHYICYQNLENIHHHLQGLSLEGSQVSMITSGEYIWFENQGSKEVSNKLEREQLRILTLPSLVAIVSDAFERVLSKEKEEKIS